MTPLKLQLVFFACIFFMFSRVHSQTYSVLFDPGHAPNSPGASTICDPFLNEEELNFYYSIDAWADTRIFCSGWDSFITRDGQTNSISLCRTYYR